MSTYTPKWYRIEDGTPDDYGVKRGDFVGSDKLYLVMLHSKFMTISYFFADSLGRWWSTQWDVYDKEYSYGEVTHWAEMPIKPSGEK